MEYLVSSKTGAPRKTAAGLGVGLIAGAVAAPAAEN
jgi:hypothetical protein